MPISKRANIERLYRDRVSFCGERKKKQKKTSFEDAGAKALKSHSRKVSHSKEQQRETKMTLSKQCMAPCAGHRNCRKQTKQLKKCVLLGSSSVKFGELTHYAKFK